MRRRSIPARKNEPRCRSTAANRRQEVNLALARDRGQQSA